MMTSHLKKHDASLPPSSQSLQFLSMPLDESQKKARMATLSSEEGSSSSVRHLIPSSSIKQTSQQVLICPHAVAFHNVVYGTSINKKPIHKTTAKGVDEDEDDATAAASIKFEEASNTSKSFSEDNNHDQENNFVRDSSSSNKRPVQPDAPWWSWKNTDFTVKYPISRLVSNATGSILAVASEETGTVSLLRGSDGKTLATRQVSGPDQSIALQFLSTSASDEHDTLWIETRAPDQPPTLIIVANIMGQILNGTDPQLLAQAAARFKIVQVPFEKMLTDEGRILAFHKDAQTIRLLVCHEQEENEQDSTHPDNGQHKESDSMIYKWTFLDFDLVKEKTESVSEQSGPLPAPFDSWEVDSSRGIYLNDDRLVVCSASSATKTALLWLNPHESSQKQIVHSLEVDHNVLPFRLRSAYKAKRFRILSLVKLQSDPNNIPDTSVVACAIQSGDECWIIVVRAACNTQAPIEPHTLFCVPIEHGQVMSLCSLKTVMGFRAWLSPRRERRTTMGHVTMDFVPQSDEVPILAQLRQLVQKGEFDEAQGIANAHKSLSGLDFCDFDDSEISFAKLSQLVEAKGENGEPPQSWLSQVKQCLSSLDVNHLVVACDSLWKTNLKSKDLIRLWNSMDTNLKRALEKEGARNLKDIEALQERIASRLQILKLVERFRLDTLQSYIEEISSPHDLWSSLFREGAFDVVTSIYSTLGEHDHPNILSVDALVTAFCETVTANTEPQKYLVLLEKLIIPRLNAINHPLLSILRAWCCQTANGLDDKDKLADAIKLLEVVDIGARKLQIRCHSSFAQYSPFVEGLEARAFTKATPKSTGILGTRSILKDRSSSKSFSSVGSDNEPLRRHRKGHADEQYPFPSVLNLGLLGPKVVRNQTRLNMKMNEEFVAFKDNECCVKDKLADAKCLATSRSYGVKRHACSLRDFPKRGGARFCIKLIILEFFRSGKATTPEGLRLFLVDKVQPFSSSLSVDFDETLLELIGEVCKGKTVSEFLIHQSSILGRCCISDSNKCRSILKVMRAALFCGVFPEWINHLSKEALPWSCSDARLRTELQEVTQLLSIHKIIQDHCGQGARDLFKVDNPAHATRLLAFIAKQTKKKSVIEDIFQLCESFPHLSAVSSFTSLLVNSFSRSRELVVPLFQTILERDITAAKGVVSRLLTWSLEQIREKRPTPTFVEEHRAIDDSYLLVADIITVFKREANDNTPLGDIEKHIADFNIILELQSKFGLLMSPVHFKKAPFVVDCARSILDPVVSSFVENQIDRCKMLSKKAEKACLLLSRHSKAQARKLFAVAATLACRSRLESISEFRHDDFLRLLGLMDGEVNQTSAVACLSVGISLTRRLFNDCREEISPRLCRDFTMGASLMQHKSLWMVPRYCLPSHVWLNTLLDNAELILRRLDMGYADQISTISKHQLERSWYGGEEIKIQRGKNNGGVVDQPVLNPTWMVGDGLLLPPNETISMVSWYFREQNGSNRTRHGTKEMLDLVSSQGSYNMVLRVLATTLAHDASQCRITGTAHLDVDLIESFQTVHSKLAERSLGGTSGGMTSGVVDSQLATAFLLEMPKKAAFKLYKSTIPIALRTRSYARLLSLANVGGKTCFDPDAGESDTFSSVGWRKQNLFFDQCSKIRENALWWTKLSSLSVSFDTDWFSGTLKLEQISTILSALISTTQSHDLDGAISLGKRFASNFGETAETVYGLVVRLLILPTAKEEYINVRFVRDSLRKIRSPSKRLSVLRECLIELEANSEFGVQYDRFSILLTFYHECLSFILDHDNENTEKDLLELELELIDRRRDALAILSAHFSDKSGARPSLPAFFVPIEKYLESEGDFEAPSLVNVLGDKGSFDPLTALTATMESQAFETSGAAPLAPLCLSLGLPQGYIHARFLMARFEICTKEKSILPSFQHDVLAVVNKLRAPKDKMMLCEWCAAQYGPQDRDRLECISMALEAATQASADMESIRQPVGSLKTGNGTLLEDIKRLSRSKSALSDRLAIRSHIERRISTSTHAVAVVLKQILIEMDQFVETDQEPTPERLVDFLLSKGSLNAGKACINELLAVSSSQFRELVSCIGDAARLLEDAHSHIHTEACAKGLARHYLFDGGKGIPSVSPVDEKAPSSGLEDPLDDMCEDDTANLVMDLSALQNLMDLSQGDSPAGFADTNSPKTSDEEPSCIRPCSARETNEEICRLKSLQSVFLLALAYEFARLDENCPGEDDKSKTPQSKKPRKRLRRAKRDDLMLESARDLMRIVFSESGSSSSQFLSMDSSFSAEQKDSRRHCALTYSIRHRALRAASFLFPQKLLEQIISEERLLSSTRDRVVCTLKECCFGIFVAKEIEEMGLDLPHSDISRLSAMDFASYSRALWRNHGSRNTHGSKGRMVQLLFEMSLRTDNPDVKFLETLVDEMLRCSLPRTLLQSMEALAAYVESGGQESLSIFGEIIEKGVAALKRSASDTQSEVDKSTEGRKFLIATLGRISEIIHRFNQQEIYLDFLANMEKE